MKIRNGFVSNSSSSSFILKFNERFPDTVSIAESMLKDKYADYSYDDPNDDWWKPSMNRAFKNVERLKKEDDPYVPIYFTSCNYNTYIIPLTKNYCLIETCNNTHWIVGDDPNIQTEIPEEVLEKYPASEGYGRTENYISLGEGKNDYDESISVIYNEEFYLIEHGAILRTPTQYSTCDKCYSDVWYFGEKSYCLNCNHDTFVRGLKLKKIKNAFIPNK